MFEKQVPELRDDVESGGVEDVNDNHIEEQLNLDII